MDEFSGLYKKMCDKAVEIQRLWRETIATRDEYCKKGDYEDGFSSTVNLEGMPKEEREELIENNVWLPRQKEIEERVFKNWGIEEIRKSVQKEFSDYVKNDDLVKKVQQDFEGDERWYALALMFVMEREFKRRWDFDNQEWIEIKKEG